MKRRICFLVAFLIAGMLSSPGQTCPSGLSGTYTIGPSGNFNSLYTALNSLKVNGLSGDVILELKTDYTSNFELIPITFPVIPCQDLFHITLRPAVGATAVSITNSSQSNTIVLDGIHNFIIDGRPGGTGTTSALTIQSTYFDASAINFRNDASNNILQYLDIKSRTSAATNGVVVFSTTTGSTGNDNNKISFCNIGLPTGVGSSNIIYADGTAGKENNNNEISNNNLYNYSSSTATSAGINITQNNSAYTITGNSIYQVANVISVSGQPNVGIRVNTSTGNDFTINGNFIGGTQPACGGTPMTFSGSNSFSGINISTGSAKRSTVDNNRISNISMTLNSNSLLPTGISIGAGKISCGTLAPNIIGSTTSNNSIILNSTTTQTNPVTSFTAISAATIVDTIFISNNLIGGIAGSGTGRLAIYGVMLTGNNACYRVTNNTIGSPTLANSITNNATTYAMLQGINSIYSSDVRDKRFTGNQIANLSSTSTGATNQVAGIYIGGAVQYAVDNVIHDLTSTGTAIGTYNGSVVGITHISGNGAVTGNTVYGLINNNPTANGSVVGIFACNASSQTQMPINNNFVHSLSATGSGNSLLVGIGVECGLTNVYNNMVRLGIDANGNSVSGNYEIRGLSQYAATTTHRISFNSVYIGGNCSGDQHSYAFYNIDSLKTKTINNNIFVNARNNSSGTGRNYAVRIRGNQRKPSGLTMLANLYHAPGSAGYIGAFNGNDYTSLSTWREMTGVDSLSGTGDPNFIDPAGNTASVNLHLNGTTPAEGSGIVDVTVINDFDNEVRTNLSPVDIGADAGDFIANDLFNPTIVYTGLNNTRDLSNRSIQVLLADAGSGIPLSGNFQPKIWMRRSAPVASAWTSAAGTLVSGTSNNGTWNFIIDYSVIGVSPVVEDVYEYYFAVQDVSGNVELGPAVGGIHADVNTQVATPLQPASYRLLDTVPSIVNVGVGELFTSLTGSNGLFRFINQSVMTADVTANITSDLLEDGTYALTADSCYDYQLHIQPSDGSIKIISNTSDLSVAMIRLFGMKNIMIDGSYNGSGRYFRFINTHTTSGNCQPVFLIDSTSSRIAIRNSIIESNISTLFSEKANIVAGPAGVNEQIEIRGNQIRDAIGSPGTAGLIGQAIQSNSTNNKLWTITGNEIFNFIKYGINFTDVGDSCVIDSNHFYFNGPSQNNHPVSLHIQSARTHTVTNNFIGGSAPFCGGGPWLNNSSTGGAPNYGFQGIYISGPTLGAPTLVSNNTIQNINVLGTGEGTFGGIAVSGNCVVSNNLIGHPSLPNSITSSATGFGSTIIGIGIGNADSTSILNNIVANVSATGTTTNVSIRGIDVNSDGRTTTKGNSIYSLTSSGAAVQASVTGLDVATNTRGSRIEDNSVHDLKGLNVSPGIKVKGLRVGAVTSSPQSTVVKQNRVFNLENLSDSGAIYGIELTFGMLRLENNQVTITNGTNSNRLAVIGIADQADSAYRYYNTVYIGGSTNNGSMNTFAYRGVDARIIKLQNNILYNERTGGNGSHFAMGVSFNASANPRWRSTSSNYNFLVANGFASVAGWGFTFVPQSMQSWRSVSLGDSSSFAAKPNVVPSATFFKSVATGDLNINNLDSICWYVNGKGLPVAQVSGDFDSSANIRSISIANGATDIGSDEFNTTTTPGPLVVFGLHVPGSIDSLLLNERLIATITWGNTGTLPTLGTARYYSGEWPHDLTNGATTNNARTMNGWLDLPVTGGSGYSYTLKFFYDSSMLGKIQDVSKLVLHKKNTGENGSWQMLFPTQINTVDKTASASGLTGFSEFTAAEATAPLASAGSMVCPGGITSYRTNITAPTYTYQWQVDAGAGFVNLVNNAVYSGVTDSILVINNPASASNRYQYRCVTNTGSGTLNSIAFTLKITSSWTGASSNDWNDPANWSCGVLPDANTDVLIRSGLENYPIITSNIICRSITASSGTTLTVNSGVAIELTGK